LVQVSRSGRQVAEIAIRVLEGENPGNVGLPTLGSGPLRFDWRALQRWGISEAQLPKNSVIEFQEPSAWQQYRWQIILIVMAMLVQTSLIISLLYERRRRRGAEAESRERLRELAYMNRRAGAGELSATIAHEINQPLAAIVASAAAALRWLAKDTPNVGEATTALNRIAADGHRASDIIKAVRAMFHKDARERQRSDINELIEDVIGLLRTELSRHSISVRLDLARGIPPVNVNRTEIQQVVLNLTMNAIEAMAATKDRSRYLVFRSSENALGEVVVDIEDSGPGIDPAVIGRVFDPFFSTKPDGTGMGLAICRSIVEAHGGKLTVAPGYPHGAVFTISLPREDGTGQ